MRGTRRALVAVVGAAALVLGAVVAPAAFAETAESGLWWYERGNIQAAHDAGFDGSGVTVAVIDSQINPDVIGLRGADIEIREPSYCIDDAGNPYPAVSTDFAAAGHGTQVVSMIVGTGEAPPGGAPIKGVAPGARVLYFNGSVIGPDGTECVQEGGDELDQKEGRFALDIAISDAVAAGADIISISWGGAADVSDGIAEAIASDVVVVAAMSNEDGISFWPAGMNGVVAVQAFGEDRKIQIGEYGTPNVSEDVEIAAPGLNVLVPGSADSWDAQSLNSGTSLATPIVAGMLAVVKQKYPDATGDQLIQSLIHNTGTKGEHEPEWNHSTGYGAASLTGMLAVDPTKYPDENPLFDSTDELEIPAQAEVDRAAERLFGSTAEPTTEPSASDPSVPASIGDVATAVMPWLIGGGVALVLLIAGAVIIVAVTRSSQRKAPAEPQNTTAQGGDDGRQ
ncbi:S8 family peptidase [Microbacterium sp.]|uniref:S8 family peptidase n=1 Tax=Microbacterium sp. TaxID=51671 RepID=UPI0039E5D104